MEYIGGFVPERFSPRIVPSISVDLCGDGISWQQSGCSVHPCPRFCSRNSPLVDIRRKSTPVLLEVQGYIPA